MSGRPSVRRSVGPSGRQTVMVIELKITKTRNFEAPVVTVCSSVCGVGEGVNGGFTALPNRPQRHCDPVSLVLFPII